jgi:uncharacterized membrane protein YedE/YeeE
MEWLMQPWPWWVSGILIGLVVPLLYFLAGRDFGISTSLQQIGAMCVPRSRLEYLRGYDRRDGLWTLVFVIGIALGGFIGARLLSSEPIAFLPAWSYRPSGAVKLLVGGWLVGFGARYAGGCTSGHSITGIANLNWPSLLATVCFFVGGIAVTWTLSSALF